MCVQVVMALARLGIHRLVLRGLVAQCKECLTSDRGVVDSSLEGLGGSVLRVLDSRQRGCGFKLHRRHCIVSWSIKTHD